jgi:hypothetical protein
MDAAFKQNNKKHNVQADSLLSAQFSYELLAVTNKFCPVISTFGSLEPTTSFRFKSFFCWALTISGYSLTLSVAKIMRQYIGCSTLSI